MNSNIAPLPPPLLVIIASDPDSAEPLVLHGDLHESWRSKVLQTSKELQQLKEQPVLVAWHPNWSAASLRPDDVARILESRRWSSRTVLLSGRDDPQGVERLETLRENHQFMAVVPHAFELERLKGWIASAPTATLEEPSPPPASWGDFANQLCASVVVLSFPPQSFPLVELVNNAANAMHGSALTSDDHRRLALLKHKLDRTDAHHRAQILDWQAGTDDQPGHWVECRLHRLGTTGRYWYTRDPRHDGAGEEEFAQWDSATTLARRFEMLADYLADRWGFTRVRLYSVEDLPQGWGRLESSDDSRLPHAWQMDDRRKPGQVVEWVMTPLKQSGYGFEKEAHVAPLDGESHWLRHSFRWSAYKSNGGAHRTGGPKTPHDADIPQPALEHTDTELCWANDVVAWGEARARVYGWLARRRNGSVQPPIIGQVVVDRRTDHIAGTKSALTGHPVEATFTRRVDAAAQGHASQDLDKSAMQAFGCGPWPQLQARLASWLDDDHRERTRAWHEQISRSILTSITSRSDGDGFTFLSDLALRLLEQWKQLFLRDQGTGAGPTIKTWLFATAHGKDNIDVPAGAGEQWEARYRVGDPGSWPRRPELQRLMGDDGALDWDFWSIPDYQSVLQRELPDLEKRDRIVGKKANEIGSWLAIRMPAVEGFQRTVMVLHFLEKDAPTASVIELAITAGKRLFAPLMLAFSERREFSHWGAAVMHEMKTEIPMLVTDLETAQTQADPDSIMSTRLGVIREQARSIEGLALDYLATLDPTAALVDQQALERLDALKIDEELEKLLQRWEQMYPHLHVVRKELSTRTVPLHAYRVWRRVLRVLLHNAFRHGRGTVEVEAVTTASHLIVTLRNGATPVSLQQLREVIEGSGGQRKTPTAYVRRRIGLHTAYRLCKSVGAQVRITCSPENAEPGLVVQRLRWPKEPPTASQPETGN